MFGVGRVGSFLAGLITSVVLLFSAASPASALPADFYGISADAAGYWNSENDWYSISHSGAQVIHMQLNWGDVTAHGGWKSTAAWENTYDKYFERAVASGLSIVPYLFGRKHGESPYYLSSDADWDEWLKFVKFAVQRYGYNGSFWAAHPTLPYRPIHVWEVWNEPNLSENSPVQIFKNGEWVPVVDPQSYAAFLVATAEEILHAQEPLRGGVPTVLHAGLFQSGKTQLGMPVGTFMSEAKKVSGYGAAFDGLSLHPYSLFGSEPEKFLYFGQNIELARNALDNSGAEGKPIYITELGWPRFGHVNLGGGKKQNVGVSEAEQTNLLKASLGFLENFQAEYNIALASWYYYRDARTPEAETWDHYCGLRGFDGAYRTAWWAFLEQTGASAWPISVFEDNLGGTITSDPAISSWLPNRLDVFGRGAGGELVHKFFEANSGGWGAIWENWGGSMASGSGPGAVSWGPGVIDILGRTSANAVTRWNWDGSTLHVGESLGGTISSDPDVSSWASGRLDAFARGASGELVHKYYEGGKWNSVWENWEGSLAAGAGPAAVSWGPGRIDIVGRAPDGSVTHWYWDGTAIHKGDPLGGSIKGDPAIASWEPGRLDVLARGSDDALYLRTFANGRWYQWEKLGGTLGSSPAAVSWGPNRIDVVAKAASGGNVLHWWIHP